MRALIATFLLVSSLTLASCGGHEPIPPKRPNTELIAGVFERHPPDGDTAIRFTTDGAYRVAKNRMQFDVDPPVAEGTYTLDGDKLVLTATKGMCAEPAGERTGAYKIVISKIGIRFSKIQDPCERRAKMDAQTWWRVD